MDYVGYWQKSSHQYVVMVVQTCCHWSQNAILSLPLYVLRSLISYKAYRLYSKLVYIILQFLGTFAKFREVIISFGMSVCLSACPCVRIEGLGSHWMNFHEILYFSFFFRKFFQKNQVSLKSAKSNRYFKTIHTDRNMLLNSYIMRNISDKSCRANKSHILCSITFFPKIGPFIR